MLRYLTLLILREGAKSGSELSAQVEGYMGWKPSPGSVYPLLRSLEEEGLIEALEEGPGGKAYGLTQAGVEELESYVTHEEEFRQRSRNIRKIYWRLVRGMPEEVYEALAAFQDELEEAYPSLGDLEALRRVLVEAREGVRRLAGVE